MWWPKYLNLSTLKRIILLIDEKINLKKNLKMNLNNIHGVLILILIHTAYVMESSRTPATTTKLIATNHHHHHNHHHRRPNTTSSIIRVTTKDDHDCGGVRKAGKNSYPVSLLNSAAKRLKKADVSLPDLTNKKKKVNAKKLKLPPPAKKSITKSKVHKRVNSSKPQKSKTHQPIKQSTTKTNKSTKKNYRSVKSAIGTILKSVTKLNKILRELN